MAASHFSSLEPPKDLDFVIFAHVNGISAKNFEAEEDFLIGCNLGDEERNVAPRNGLVGGVESVGSSEFPGLTRFDLSHGPVCAYDFH